MFALLRFAGALLLGATIVTTISGGHNAAMWYMIGTAWLCSITSSVAGFMEDKYKRV